MTPSIKHMGSYLRALPLLGPAAARARDMLGLARFNGSGDYWERRYARGGNSGGGSYGRLNAFKAEIINDVIRRNGLRSAVEFGCGDGAQLETLDFDTYLGVDVSATAVSRLRERFVDAPHYRFLELADATDIGTFDAAMSLDVIYHLVEDEVFDAHMRAVFAAAGRTVIIYASNHDEQPADKHVRHREFTRWVETHKTGWRLVRHIANPYPFDWKDPRNTSFADFFVYARAGDGAFDAG